MSYQITSEPAVEPVTVAEARAHLRYEGESYDDTYITSIIKTARRICENYCNRVFITQTWRQNENSFGEKIELKVSPVQSVTSVKYYDSSETQQTLSTSNYQVDLLDDVSTIYEGVSAGFPTTSTSTINPIEIIYICGYGDASTDIPEDIIHAVKLMISHLYENREGVNVSMTNASQIPLPDNVKQLLGFYRVKHFG
jgi:uncharacterized phiE125 gp8 family phage protein